MADHEADEADALAGEGAEFVGNFKPAVADDRTEELAEFEVGHAGGAGGRGGGRLGRRGGDFPSERWCGPRRFQPAWAESGGRGRRRKAESARRVKRRSGRAGANASQHSRITMCRFYGDGATSA